MAREFRNASGTGKQAGAMTQAKQMEVAGPQEPPGTVDAMAKFLQKNIEQIALAAPKSVDPSTMIRLARTMLQTNPDLLECSGISILGCVIQAAQLGLELDGFTGAAYMVPYWNKHTKRKEAQLIPGYRGLMRLARRSGEVTNIMARVVRQGDAFEVHYGTDEAIIHQPNPAKPKGSERETLAAVYAFAEIKGATKPQFDFMWNWEVEEVRACAPGKDNGPWVTDYAAMAMKTVVRRLCKFLPVSLEVQKAVTLDELHQAGLGQDLSNLVKADAVQGLDLVTLPAATNQRDAGGDHAPNPNSLTEQITGRFAELLETGQTNDLLADDIVDGMKRLQSRLLLEYAADKASQDIVAEVAATWIAKAKG